MDPLITDRFSVRPVVSADPHPTRSREQVLAAGSAVLAKRRFIATTTTDIATRTGVNAALSGRHFGSKVVRYLASLGSQDDGIPIGLR